MKFSSRSRTAARATLAVWIILAVVLAATAFSMPTFVFGANQGSYDLEYHRKITEAVHAGNGYYEANAILLPKYGLATNSVFNWRQPTFYVVISHSYSVGLWHWILLAFALATVACTVMILCKPTNPFTASFYVVMLLGGAFGWSFYEYDSFATVEPWCECLLLLSLCAYKRERHWAGMLMALCALALRELMLPYCVICLFMAWREKRKMEAWIWVVALAIYIALVFVHWGLVREHSPTDQPADVAKWLRPFQLQFVACSGSMNVFLRALPPWALGLYLSSALIGVYGLSGSIGLRIKLYVFGCVLAFTMLDAGGYWGYIYSAPLLLGFFNFPAMLSDLIRTAFVSDSRLRLRAR